MISYLYILSVIHKETIENLKKENEKKVLKRFLILHFFIFIFACVLTLSTGIFGFMSIIFIPYIYIFSPKAGFVQRVGIVVNYKEFYLSILFSCISTGLFFILLY